jgi:hypothetical protein
MSDYKRTRDALSRALPAGDMGDPRTFEYALDAVTGAALSLLADEVEHWVPQLRFPPVAAAWPAGSDADGCTPRQAYLLGWKAASDVLEARAAALRLAERADADTPAR